MPDSWKVLLVEHDGATAWDAHAFLVQNGIDEEKIYILTNELQWHLRQRLFGRRTRTRRQLGHLYSILCGAQLMYDAHSMQEIPLLAEVLLQEGPFPMAIGDNVSHILNPYAFYGLPEVLLQHSPVHIQQDSFFEFRKMQAPLDSQEQRPLAQLNFVSPMLGDNSSGFYRQPKGARVAQGYFSFLVDCRQIIFHANAFWGLSVIHWHDEALGWYVLQRLLWILQGEVLISHSIRQDCPQIKSLSKQSVANDRVAELLSLLLNWVEPQKPMDQMILSLLQVLVVNGFLGIEDVQSWKDWVADLAAVGYAFPKPSPIQIEPTKSLAAFCFSGEMDRSPRGITETLRSMKRLLTASNASNAARRLATEVQHLQEANGTIRFHYDVFAYLSTHGSCPMDVQWMSESTFTYGIM